MNLKPPSCYNPLPILKGSIDDAAPWANQCCPLASLSKGFAYPEGSCSSGVLIVSDKLSKDDALDGFFLRPHTAAGSILNRALSAAGVARDQVGIYGVVACNPPNGSLNGESYEHDSIAHCAKNLEKVYHHFQSPPVILALGSIAARTLTGLTGERLSLDMIQGFPLAPEGRTVPFMLGKSIIVPSYSPEYIERGNSQLLLVLIRDIRFAFQLAQRLKARFSDVPQVQAIFDALQHKPQYALHANHFHLSTLYKQMKDGYVKRLGYDFETPGKINDNALLEGGDATYQAFTNQKITQVNFSIDRNHAIVADYDPQTAPIIQDILACTSNVPKVGHNVYCFDQPVARYNSFEIRGRHIDTMFKFHHIYPDLPGKGKANKSEAEGASLSSNDGDEDGALAPLQFCASFYGFPLPWKHLFKLDPHLYGAYDSDASLWVDDGCNASLEALGLTESHEKYVVQLRLVLDDMERRGLPCSPKKLLELSNHLAGMLKESSVIIRTCVPDEALSTTPAKGYAKTPKALLEGVEQAISLHVEAGNERETFDVASYALSKRYVWKSHSLIGQRCSCVKITKNNEDALPKCPHCLGTGLKATVRKIPCKQCLDGSGRIDCQNCKGEGFTSTVRVPKPRAKGKSRRAKRSAVATSEAKEQMSLFSGEEEEAEHCETPKIRMEINLEEVD